jgi:O-antigen/teichoic acid export membrane protein
MKTHNGFSQLQNGASITINFIADFMKRFFPKGRFFRGVAVIAGGTAFAQLLNVVASPILTRLYLPQDFGVFAIFSSYLGILSVAASYRYEMAIPLPATDSDAGNLLLTSMAFTGFNCLLLCLLILTLGDFFVKVTNVGRFGPYLWLLPFGFAGVGLYHTFTYWAIRKRYYTVLGRTRATRSFFQIGSQLLLGAFKTGPIGLLIGHIIGEAGGLSQLARMAWSKDKAAIKKASVSQARKVASRYRKFPFYMTWASILNTAGLRVPALLFASFYGPEMAGWFFLTQKVIAMPVMLVGKSVSQVFIGEAVELTRTNPILLKKLYRKLNIQLLLPALMPCIILVFYGDIIFKTIFGDSWIQSGKYVQVMAFVFLLKLTLESVISLAILERQELDLIWSVFRLVLVSCAIVASSMKGFSPFQAVVLYSAAMVISYLLKYALWSYAVNQKIREHF